MLADLHDQLGRTIHLRVFQNSPYGAFSVSAPLKFKPYSHYAALALHL